jgi:hypothetical protein
MSKAKGALDGCCKTGQRDEGELTKKKTIAVFSLA